MDKPPCLPQQAPWPAAVAQRAASFFVSRVDTEIDRQLTEIGTPEALAVRGQARCA